MKIDGDKMKITVGAKTLLFPTPVLMVGTYDQAGKPFKTTIMRKK